MAFRLRMWLVALVALSSSACWRANPSFAAEDTGDDGGSSTRGDEASTGGSLSSGVSSVSNTQGSSEGETSVDPTAGSEGPMPSECGNGIKEDGEKCDDGPANARDGHCQPDCTANECGDGEPSPSQPCDDANDVPDDGCHECRLTSCGNNVDDPGEACDHGPEGSIECTPLCTLPVCGDGIVTMDLEVCDDENTIDEDACVQCQHAVCGDGFTHEGEEECDDHNTDDDDGCSSACLEEQCGDGIVQVDEECDGRAVQSPPCSNAVGDNTPLDCDPEACVWVLPMLDACCMAALAPCLQEVACCGELVCSDGVCAQGG